MSARGPAPWVVGSDLSPASDDAVTRAAVFAAAVGAELVVVHATHPEVADPAPGFAPEIDAALAAWRARLATDRELARVRVEGQARLAEAAGARARAALLEGPAAEALLAEARRIGAGVVVVGAHGHRARAVDRAAEAVLGSTASRVVRAAPCPVLVLPGDGLPGAGAVTAGTWVFGTDLSDLSQAALACVVPLAAALGARLTVVHSHVPVPVVTSPLDASWIATLRAHLRTEAEQKLGAWVGAAGTRGEAPTAEVSDGDPAESLLAVAERLDARVVVVGTHGRGGLGRALLGSVAERVLRRSTRPVLVVSPQAHAPGPP